MEILLFLKGFKAPRRGLSQFGLPTWKSCQSSQPVPSLSQTFHKPHDPTSQDTEQEKATSGLYPWVLLGIETGAYMLSDIIWFSSLLFTFA